MLRKVARLPPGQQRLWEPNGKGSVLPRVMMANLKQFARDLWAHGVLHGALRAGLSVALLGLGVGSSAYAQEPLSYTWGLDTAPVVLVEFSDFGCSACGKFHRESYATLFREYVESGKVRWTFVPFVSGQFLHSMEAAEAASCSALQPGGLTLMTVKLFETQAEWSRASDLIALFGGYAEELGLDRVAVESCMTERQTEPGIRAAGERALELGVRATPTFFMDGFPVPGALPLDFFRQLFDKHLSGKGEAANR